MELYHTIIENTLEELGTSPDREWSYHPEDCWEDLGENELVMQREAAFELGGKGKDALHYLCVTSEDDRVKKDEIRLYGKDLSQIREDTAYARILFISLKEMSGEEEALYQEIRDLEFVKYRIFPEGFMMRISAATQREQVRVRRESLKRGISFQRVGALFIREYKKNPRVNHVQVLFVTREDLVTKLDPLATKTRKTTEGLSHILEGLPTDCGACNMKEICDEVEGMRELHFGREQA